jgi:thiamine-monophosphate kinase
MRLADLGEFGFIAKVRRAVQNGAGVELGIGDDCAVLRLPADELLLTTSDLLIEDVHFRRSWTGLEDLGRKSVAVNLSDIAAMGGTPRFLYLALGIPAELPMNELEALVAGFVAEAEAYGTTLVGGDTCRSPGPLLISVTAEGSVPPAELVRRSGVRPGDGIYVSGTLGDSALALRELQAGRAPDQFLAGRHHRPTARIGLGRRLAASRLPSAMIDISDGLLADLGHLLAASQVGAELTVDDLPLSPVFAAQLTVEPELLDLALGGGEDYELLFTVPAAGEARLLAADWPVPVTRIGTAGSVENGLLLKDRHGRRRLPATGGFNHFAAFGTSAGTHR